MKKKYALGLTFIAFATLNIFASTLWDTILFTKEIKREYSCAAIAIRDSVPGYQKLATKIFSKPYLNKRYDDIFYLEDRSANLQQIRFLQSLTIAANRYDSIDIFLLAHSNRIIDWLKGVSPAELKKIRLVYNCGCRNFSQGQQWQRYGVKYYLGHTGENSLSPIFWFFFLKRWANGYTLQKSIAVANRKTMLLLQLIGQSKSKATESCARLYISD